MAPSNAWRLLAAAALLASAAPGGGGLARAASVSATQTPSNPPSASRAPSPSSLFVPGVMRTLAGTGVAGYGGDGGPATSASMYEPTEVAFDAGGNVLVADMRNNRIRQINITTGIITTVAGNGVQGFSGDGGPATSASLNSPHGLFNGAGGSVLIADYANHRIRLFNTITGVIETVAGNGVGGFSGDGGPATSASIGSPLGGAFDAAGLVYIADFGNSRVRMLNLSSGIISTVAGNGVQSYSGDGGPATSAGIVAPCAVISFGGYLYIADIFGHRIRLLSVNTGILTTVAGNGVADYSGDNGLATSASLFYPRGLAQDADGNILISSQHSIRLLNTRTGRISTVIGNGVQGFSGDGGPATSASFNQPSGLLVDSGGNLIIVDRNDHRVRMLTSPTQRTPTPSPSPSTTPYCAPALFRAFPRMDLVGSLVGTALAPGESVTLAGEPACRQACCDAAACDGYAFEAESAKRAGLGGCFLYVNITQLVPSSGYASGIYRSAL